MMDKKIIFMMLVLVFSSLAFAVPQSSEWNYDQLIVVSSKFDYLALFDDYVLNFGVLDSDGGLLNNSLVDCSGNFYDVNGTNIFSGGLVKSANFIDHSLVLNSSLIGNIGDHYYSVYCNASNGEFGYFSSVIGVTRTGLSYEDMFKVAISYIFGLSILLFLLLYIAFNLDKRHIVLKFFIVSLSIFLGITIIRAIYLLEPNSLSIDLTKYYMRFIKVYVVYVFLAFIWFIGEYYGKTDYIKRFFKDKFGRDS